MCFDYEIDANKYGLVSGYLVSENLANYAFVYWASGNMHATTFLGIQLVDACYMLKCFEGKIRAHLHFYPFLSLRWPVLLKLFFSQRGLVLIYST